MVIDYNDIVYSLLKFMICIPETMYIRKFWSGVILANELAVYVAKTDSKREN